MYQSSLFPLRTIVGGAIPLGKQPSIRKVFESEESKKLEIEYEFSSKPSILETRTDHRYLRYLPTFDVDGTVILPGEGMDSLPFPPGVRPFANDDQVLSFFALSKKKATADDVSRKLSVRYSISLPERSLVGGICFGGFPYLPSLQRHVSDHIHSAANCGLPREIRLTCTGARTADRKDTSSLFGFLDSEISATKQDIASRSGFHFLCIDPTLTNVVTIHFSDYPRLLTASKLDTKSGKCSDTERYGFIIPYFYLFAYEEDTRYRPSISAGLLGTTTNSEIVRDEDNPFPPAIDHRAIVSYADGANYFDFTAASSFGQQRRYTIRDERYTGKEPKGKIKTEMRECFISRKIPSGENVVLVIEQGEEYERCTAGLKIFLPFVPEVALKEDVERVTAALRELFPNSPDFSVLIQGASREDLEKFLRQYLEIPGDIDFCEKIGLRVYELDPLDGVSPLDVPLDSKFATLLAEATIDELSEISLALFLEGVKFVRPSNSRFLAVELTNLHKKPGQFVVQRMGLVQSAHVSIHPRAARTQQLKALNFRIVGADLAEDYSFLGKEGFNFSIERLVAGERKSVLFRANSLLDLLHTGAAKIFSNVRRRAVEFEQVSYSQAINNDHNLGAGTANYDIRQSEVSDKGWRRSETGTNANPNTAIRGDGRWYLPMQFWSGQQNPDAVSVKGSIFGFSTLGSRELRTHVDNLFPERVDPPNNSNEWNAMFNYLNLLGTISNLGGQIIANPRRLDSGGWANRAWIGTTSPLVRGHRNISFHPLTPLADLVSFVDDIINNRPFDIAALGSALLGNVPLLLTGGTNTSVGFAGIVTIGIQPIPNLNFSATVGSAGNITRSASEEAYSYSQFLNRSFGENRAVSYGEEGNQNRKILRKEVPDTERQRIKGAEVMWQGALVDIITGSIPLNVTLPATAEKMHFRTSDDSLRVRFGSGVGQSISVDFWFDLNEEMIKDDH